MSQKEKLSRNFKAVDGGEFFQVYLSDDGLSIMINYLEGTRIDVKQAHIVINTIYPYLKQGVKYGLTKAEAPNIHITAEARKVYSNNKSVAKTKAHAVITKSVMVKLIANIFAKFDNPIVPVRTFKSLNGAMNWLEKNHHQAELIKD